MYDQVTGVQTCALPISPKPDELVDATGAGDVFLAALMAAWLLTGDVATPATLGFAAAAGSCAVEGEGLAGVPTRSQVVARLRGLNRG
jgi:sugar/nucleoside kinase (ribokinase family)